NTPRGLRSVSGEPGHAAAEPGAIAVSSPPRRAAPESHPRRGRTAFKTADRHSGAAALGRGPGSKPAPPCVWMGLTARVGEASERLPAFDVRGSLPAELASHVGP